MSSGVWCCIVGWDFPIVLKELWSLKKIWYYSPSDTVSHPKRLTVQKHHCEYLMCCKYDILQGWIQTWYSDCQEQLGDLNKQIYTVLQKEESLCQEADTDKPVKQSVTPSDIRSLLESKEQLLSQAEGKLWGLYMLFNALLIGCHHSGCESWGRYGKSTPSLWIISLFFGNKIFNCCLSWSFNLWICINYKRYYMVLEQELWIYFLCDLNLRCKFANREGKAVF